ncbi:MAG: hypothetical protein AAB363_09225 [Planctomycetota bacterium]
MRTATRMLVPLWHRGGRCSRRRAEAIAAQLLVTQQRNAASYRSHRKKTRQKLRDIGVQLRRCRTCRWLKI